MMVERAERILERGMSLREALGRALCGGQTAGFDALSGGHWVALSVDRSQGCKHAGPNTQGACSGKCGHEIPSCGIRLLQRPSRRRTVVDLGITDPTSLTNVTKFSTQGLDRSMFIGFEPSV